jgi:hypothetical protein
LHNKIIAGIWFGKNKLISDILFSSIVQEVKNLGCVEIEKYKNKKRFLFDFYGLIVETPAKALFKGMTNFNGYYSCTYYLNPVLIFLNILSYEYEIHLHFY